MCAKRSSRAKRGGPAGTGKQVTRSPLGVPSRWQSPNGWSGTISPTATSANARVTARMRESSSTTRRTASVATSWIRRASRRSTIPSVWSSSASVKTMPSTGTWRTPAGAGEGRRPSCSRTSGEAFSRNQRAPSALTATEDWLRGTARLGSARATRQGGHQQFHWGKPPPAAVPRRTICTLWRLGS